MNGGGKNLSDILLMGKGFLGEKIHSLYSNSYKIKTADINEGQPTNLFAREIELPAYKENNPSFFIL